MGHSIELLLRSHLDPEGSGITATATASINAFTLYGGNVTAVSIGNSGKFYGSAPTVTIEHPGTDRAEATIGLVGGAVTAYDTGSALDNSSVAISTGGKAYSSQPTVTVGLGTGTVDPTTTAVGIATINSIGVVTAISFDPTEVWAVGQGATIGAGYTVVSFAYHLSSISSQSNGNCYSISCWISYFNCNW